MEPVVSVRTLRAGYVNTVGLIFGLTAAAMVVLLYMMFWGHNPVMTFFYTNTGDLNPLTNPAFWLACFELLLLVAVLYEVMHIISFLLIGVRSRDIQFRMVWQEINPVISCSKPLRLHSYRFTLLLPGLIIGVLPILASLILGLEWLLVFGAVGVISSAPDVLVLLLTARLRPGTRIMDHPTQPGFIILP